MPGRRTLFWCGGLLSATVLIYYFPLFHVQVLEKAVTTGRHASPTPDGATDPASLPRFADEVWNIRIRSAFSTAVEIDTLFDAIDRDPKLARSEFGHQVGLGGACYFFVRGEGRLEEVTSDHCIAIIGDHGRKVFIETGVIAGNAVRDATGLVDVNRFANSQDFNNLSAELNRKVESLVIGPVNERLRAGARVRFFGCAEVVDTSRLDPFRVVPVELKVDDPGRRP